MQTWHGGYVLLNLIYFIDIVYPCNTASRELNLWFSVADIADWQSDSSLQNEWVDMPDDGI